MAATKRNLSVQNYVRGILEVSVLEQEQPIDDKSEMRLAGHFYSVATPEEFEKALRGLAVEGLPCPSPSLESLRREHLYEERA